MKLFNLVSEYYDPPEYPDPDREGFRDSSLDDVDNIFTFLGRDEQWGWTVLKLDHTERLFLCIDDEIDEDYYYGQYYSDGYNDDYDELVQMSYEVYCSVRYQAGEISKDIDSYEDDKGPLEITNNSLREMYIYDKDMYVRVIKILKDYNSKKIKK
jgi:hypothetical protein